MPESTAPSPSTRRTATPWIGRWLIVVAIIHTAFSGIVFATTVKQIIALGVFDSIGADPLRGAVAWFILFGLVLFALGLAIDEIERYSSRPPSRRLGLSLAVFVALGILLMPASGFWLAVPPTFILLRGNGGR